MLLEMAGRKVKVILPPPHSEAQARFYSPPSQINLAACGTKFGKTRGVGTWLWKEAVVYPEIFCRWIAPVYRQAEIAFTMLRKNSPRSIAKVTVNPMRITFKHNGSMIEFVSAEKPYNLEGEAVDRWVFDEAAKAKKQAWLSHLTTIAQTKGVGWAISTPLGRNWFYQECMKGAENREGYSFLTMPTIANPYIDRKWLKLIRAEIPADTWRQYYEAEFLEDSAGVFRNLGKFFDPALPAWKGPQPFGAYIQGLDLAKHADFTVLSTLDSLSGEFHGEGRWNALDWPEQMGLIADENNRFGNPPIVVDATPGSVGDVVFDSLRERLPNTHLIAFKFTNATKKELIQRAAAAIQNGRYRSPKDDIAETEFSVFEYQMTPAGNVTYNAPEGFHDDIVISRSLAIWGNEVFVKTGQVPPGGPSRMGSGGGHFAAASRRGRRLTN